MSVNKVILIGNVGSDPETRHTENSQVSNFSIATFETYKNKSGENVSKTEWHKIVAWNKQSEIIEKHVKKGTQLYIEGKLQTTSWEDKNGVKKYTTEINLSVLKFIGAKKESETQTEVKAPETKEEETDDLPF